MTLVPPVAGVPSATFIGLRPRMDATEFILSTGELSVIATLRAVLLPETGRTIDRRLLFPSIQSSGTTEVSWNEQRLWLQTTGSRAALETVRVHGWNYQEWPFRKPWVIELSKDLIDLLHCARLCAETDPIRGKLTGVIAEFAQGQARVVAASDWAMCQGSVTTNNPDGRVVFPVAFIDAVSKLRPRRMYLENYHVGFETSDARVWGAAQEMVWKEFPLDTCRNLFTEASTIRPAMHMPTKAMMLACKKLKQRLQKVPQVEWEMSFKGLGNPSVRDRCQASRELM